MARDREAILLYLLNLVKFVSWGKIHTMHHAIKNLLEVADTQFEPWAKI